MSSRKQEQNVKTHRCRDEIKKDQALDTKRMKIVNNVNNVTKAILEQPSLWHRPEFSTLRDFVQTVTNNPSKFRMNNKASSLAHENLESVQLSSDFVIQIE